MILRWLKVLSSDLGIKSESDIFGITLRQPVYRTVTQEFALALTGERLYNKTFLFDTPFPFTIGATENGVSQVTAIRFSQEWVRRTSAQVDRRVLALLSRN